MHSHPKPPWWPEDEPWPPQRWGHRHGSERPSGRGAPPRVAESAPDGDSSEPSEWWGGRRRGDVRRGFGCLVALMSTLIVSIGVLILWLLAGLLGVASMEGPLAYLARPAGLIVLVVGIVALIVGIRIARGVARPLSELVDAAGRIEA